MPSSVISSVLRDLFPSTFAWEHHLADLCEYLRNAIVLDDAWQFSDWQWDSSLGRFNGKIYHDLFHLASESGSLNTVTFDPHTSSSATFRTNNLPVSLSKGQHTVADYPQQICLQLLFLGSVSLIQVHSHSELVVSEVHFHPKTANWFMDWEWTSYLDSIPLNAKACQHGLHVLRISTHIVAVKAQDDKEFNNLWLRL